MTIPGGIKSYIAKNKLAYEDSKKRMMQHFEKYCLVQRNRLKVQLKKERE